MCKISVIAPFYGVEEFIVRFVESLVRQDFFDIEFIIINDASKDKSFELIKPYLSDSRFKYVENTKNIGLLKSRQKGFELSKGEFIINLDPDDIISDSFFSKVSESIEFTDADIVVTNVEIIDEFDDIKKSVKTNIFKQSKLLSDKELNLLIGIPYGTWCRIVRRDIMQKYKYNYEQHELVLSAFHFIDNIKTAVVSDATYFYRNRSNSMSKYENSSKRLKNGNMNVQIEYFYECFSNLPSSGIREKYKNLFFYTALIKLIFVSCIYDTTVNDYNKQKALLKNLSNYDSIIKLKTLSKFSYENLIFGFIDLIGISPFLLKLYQIKFNR